MRRLISLFLVKIKILTYAYLIILLNPYVNFASLVEEQEIFRKHHILEQDKNKRAILEKAQEIWVREKDFQKSKAVSICGEDIVVKVGNGITWVSSNGQLTCFPTNLSLKEIMVGKRLPILEFQTSIPSIDLKQRGIILEFLSKENDYVGFVKMFMLEKKTNHQVHQTLPIKRIWVRYPEKQ